MIADRFLTTNEKKITYFGYTYPLGVRDTGVFARIWPYVSGPHSLAVLIPLLFWLGDRFKNHFNGFP
jgi:hypothetical protein